MIVNENNQALNKAWKSLCQQHFERHHLVSGFQAFPTNDPDILCKTYMIQGKPRSFMSK